MTFSEADSGPSIETRRLHLRPVTAADLDQLHELDADPEVRRFLDQPNAPTRQESVRALHRFLVRHGPQAEPAFWASEKKEDGSFLGWFHLRPVGDQPFTFDLGYRLRRAAWGRGNATEGASALLHRAFKTLGAQRVVAHALEANGASQRVLEKVGMQLREHFLHRGELPAVNYSLERLSYLTPSHTSKCSQP